MGQICQSSNNCNVGWKNMGMRIGAKTKIQHKSAGTVYVWILKGNHNWITEY